MLKKLKHIDEVLKLYPTVEALSDGEYSLKSVKGIRYTINNEMRLLMRRRAVIEVEEHPSINQIHYRYDFRMVNYSLNKDARALGLSAKSGLKRGLI